MSEEGVRRLRRRLLAWDAHNSRDPVYAPLLHNRDTLDRVPTEALLEIALIQQDTVLLGWYHGAAAVERLGMDASDRHCPFQVYIVRESDDGDMITEKEIKVIGAAALVATLVSIEDDPGPGGEGEDDEEFYDFTLDDDSTPSGRLVAKLTLMTGGKKDDGSK